MEAIMENLESSVMDLKSGQYSWSLQGGDSNAIIMPERKSNKKKDTNKVKTKESIKLSKSQKRKLKKLAEEKEKECLLSKSIETLEKYKIPEDAYSLLQSSRNIGQAETMLEKRRRFVQFSKAGLEVPQTEDPLKREANDSVSCEDEPQLEKINSRLDFNENNIVQPLMVENDVIYSLFVSMDSSQQPVSKNEIGRDGRSHATLPAKEVANKNNNINNAKAEDIKGSSFTLCICDPQKNAELMDGSRNVDFNRTSNSSDCPLQRTLSAPTVVHVSRSNEVENKRKDLPIVMMEQEIMEAVNDHSSVIICGETGCGKTTQVPQFLYEAGFGSNQSSFQSGIIGVTQPRRVAVLATAKRVAFELGLRLGKEVGFQVRHDKKIGDSCSIKFMTDGILLREVKNDILLKRYSVIILDEAHERSLNTDILIGMLSRIIRLRQDMYEKQKQTVLSGQILSPENMIFPLKLVLMSATLRVEDFISGQRLFREPPPVMEVPTRQFPVTVHFSKRTEIVDYIGQAYKKVLSIHRRLPQGGILVFVTGQREVEYLCNKLRKASAELVMRTSKEETGNEVSAVSELNSIEGINMEEINEAFEIHGKSADQQNDRFNSYYEDPCDMNEDESDVSYDLETESELEVCDDGGSFDQITIEDDGNLLDVLGEGGSFASLKAVFEALIGKTALKSYSELNQTTFVATEGCSDQLSGSTRKKGGEKMVCLLVHCVLPLYAMLPAAAQLRVFEEVKEGERLVVISTNVAETSLTIQGIKYVVDTGREKVKNYSSNNGMETYEVQWISKASLLYMQEEPEELHLATVTVFILLQSLITYFLTFEISKIHGDGVVLLLKSMGIDKVANFPFPTPPWTTALVEAERCLKALEALDSSGRLTPLGRSMAHYPMSPRHSRMLLTVNQIARKLTGYARANLVLGYAVAAAAALSLSNPFVLQFEGSHTNSDDLQKDEKFGTQDSKKK